MFLIIITNNNLIFLFQIGSLCVNIVEFELARYQEWKEELGPREGRKEVVSRLPLPKRSATPSPSPHDRHRLTLSACTTTIIPIKIYLLFVILISDWACKYY